MSSSIDEKAKAIALLETNGIKKYMSIQLNLTNKCIATCNMCRKDTWPQANMDLALLEKIKNDIIDYKVNTVVLSGGEPFLHPELPNICKSFTDNGISYGIITSGLWNKDKETYKKAIINASWVRFSIDSVDEEEYKKIRGNTLLPMAIENLEYAAMLNKNVRVNATLQKENIKSKDKIEKHFKNLGIEVKFYNAFGTNEEVHMGGVTSKSKQCHILDYHCIIDPDGSVFPCCHTYGDNEIYTKEFNDKYSYANLKDASLDGALRIFIRNRSKRYEKLKNKEFDVCKTCDRYDDINCKVEDTINEIFI